MPSLKKILDSLGKAIPGVMNAFLVMLIFMCIYAIIGTEFFLDVTDGPRPASPPAPAPRPAPALPRPAPS